MKIGEIVWIQALDHFETDENTRRCIIEVYGEIVEENDDYVYIRKFSWEHGEKTVMQIEGILKAVIIKQKTFIHARVMVDSLIEEAYKEAEEKLGEKNE